MWCGLKNSVQYPSYRPILFAAMGTAKFSKMRDGGVVLILFCTCCRVLSEYDKNSSGDEIANVNFLRRYRTYFKILKKRTYFVSIALLPSSLTKYQNLVCLLVLSLPLCPLTHLLRRPHLPFSPLSGLPLNSKSLIFFLTFLTNNLILIPFQPGFLKNVLQFLFPLSLAL